MQPAASPVINHQAARLATVTVLRLDEWWSLKPVKLLFLNGSRPETSANADTFPGVLIYTENCVPFTGGLDRSVVNGNNIDMPKMQHKNQLINIFFWKYHSWLQATLAEAEAVIRCILAELRSVEFLNFGHWIFLKPQVCVYVKMVCFHGYPSPKSLVVERVSQFQVEATSLNVC